MRRALVEALIEMAEGDPRVVFLTGDLGYGVFDSFIARFPTRYINVGIAEAQLVNAAAGLALEGFRPVIYSIASFMTGRPWEQLRFCVAYPHLPVIVVGAGGGYCYAASGVSHHAADDLALMSLLPGMTVVAPGDPAEIRALLPQMLQLDGPSYMRIGKYGEPTCEAIQPAVLGQGRCLREGREIALISTGEMAPAVLQAADCLAHDGLRPLVYHFHTLKPLDTDCLEQIAAEAKIAVVVEEAVPQGGLYAAILAWKNERGHALALTRVGPPDAFVLGNPRLETLRTEQGLVGEALAQTCRRLLTPTDSGPAGRKSLRRGPL